MINYTLDKKIRIADRLKEERTAKGLTQDGLSLKISASKSTIVSWEKRNGINIVPSMENLIELAEFYNCDVAYLLCDIDTRRNTNPDIIKETGLSEKSIEILRDGVRNPNTYTEVNVYRSELSKEISFQSKGNDFINAFIENSQGVVNNINREIDVMKIGNQWKNEDGFHFLEECFKKAIGKKQLIPSLKIYFNIDYEEEVIKEAIQIFSQHDYDESISSRLYVYHDDGTPNTDQLRLIFSFLYEAQVKSEERRYRIMTEVMSIIESYISDKTEQ